MKAATPRIILAILVVMTAVCSNLNFGKNKSAGVLEADARGYYAYLPAVFIYHDLNFGFYQQIDLEKYYNPKLLFEYRAHVGEILINKYYCGTAIAQMPLFLAAHAICPLTGYEQDGYSKPYMISIYLSALAFLLLGLIYTNKLLQLYGFSDGARAWTLVFVVFATNLFYYTVVEGGMSHVYSFGWISLFLYFTKKYFVDANSRLIPGVAALLAIIILTRPVNGIILAAVPFMAGSSRALSDGIRNGWRNRNMLLAGLCTGFLILMIQLLIYRISTGSWIVYSYEYETFRFLDPHFGDMLFSYKKGLFLYTPYYLLSLAGIYLIYKRNRYEAVSLFCFLILTNYVMSSWWQWWYGGSFSARVYIEFLPLFAITGTMAIQQLQGAMKKAYLAVSVLLLIICQIQTYQYRYYQIHWENMDAEKYWNVFLRIDELL